VKPLLSLPLRLAKWFWVVLFTEHYPKGIG